MAFVHGKDTVILGGSVALTGDLNQVQPSFQRQAVDVTTFGNNDRVYVAGVGGHTLSLGGLFNASLSDPEWNTQLSGQVTKVMTVGVGGTTIGNRGYLHQGHLTGHAVRSSNDDAVRLNVSMQGTGAVGDGVFLHALGAETSTGAFSSVDEAASSANGGIGHLHVTAFTGTDVTIKIQDSADDAAWADLITFSSVTGVTSERATVTGTIDRYVRANITAGTFTTVTFAVAFARSKY